MRVTGDGRTAGRTLGLRARQVLALWGYIEGDRARYVALATAAGERASGEGTGWLLSNTLGRQLSSGLVSGIVNRGRGRAEWLLPQKIRQTVIAELVSAGHELRVVQAFAGHRGASTTERYRRTGSEELAEAVSKHHPRG